MQNCRYIATKSVESSGKFRFFSPPHRTATQHLLFYTYIRYSTATFPFYSSPSSSIILPAGLQIVFGCELKLPLLLLGMGSFEGKLDLENGGWGSTKAEVEEHPAGAGAGASCRTAHSLSSSMVRKKSDPELVSRVRFRVLRDFLANLQEVILGTKLCVLFPAIPLAVLAQFYSFGRPWIFALSLLGLAPLAERVSFLTEQIANYTGPTVGGLLNATCGNATELIIALLALHQRKIHVVKYSLLGSILSNLLLVLGSSLFCGGLANIKKEQRFDRKQADVNAFLLLLGLLCLMLPLMFRYSFEAGDYAATSVLWLSRVSSIFMFVAYIAYLFFQLKTHRQFFEAPEEEGDKLSEDEAVIGFWSAFVWLIAMTITIALLSEYVVGTIEAASDSWGLSVSFISLILLPIVGNAAEHAGSIIFAFKNKLDISLGVALGSASQILMFVVPLCVLVGWIMGTRMDLDFSLLETGSLVISIILTAFTLQDGTSHYMKGVILCLSYCAIAACFFLHKLPVGQDPGSKPTGVKTA